MFDSRLEESLGDPRALLHLAADNLVAEREASCRKLLVAAAWADCHGAPAELEIVDGEPVQGLCEERYLRLGGACTPLVAESCPAELGVVLQTSVGSARRLVAGALTLRHRMPMLWARVQAGDVWGWKALQIADRTRHLGGLSSWCVDQRIAQYVEAMAWTRFCDLLDATLLHVDEATYQRRAAEAASQRDVHSYRGEHGLRTLVAKVEAGDGAAFEALVARVAECLAAEGDEDPVGVRRSKAVGIIAHQARLRHLLARHAEDLDDPRHPEQRVAAHQDNPTDPWAADDLPPAGWETDRHGNYHQPGLDDLDDVADCRDAQGDGAHDDGWGEESPVDESDRDWYEQQRDEKGREADKPAGRPIPAAFDRRAADNQAGHCRGCACGSTFDLRPLTQNELNASRTHAVVHVHVTDRTLLDQRGVLRTADGPITLEQFRRWLTDADASISIRPVLDPAAVAAVDSYEISGAMREAVHTRHPGSVWPYSPVTTISPGGRLDLDHGIPYRKNGPPGQTAVDTLGPLARSEHRPKTMAGWQVRQPDSGSYVWRSPHGWVSIVTNQGTLLLGHSPWANAVWHATQPGAVLP